MTKTSTAVRALLCALFVMGLSTIAQAQATRTWVSGVGDDVNPCSRTAPCKTYAGAISKTAVHGEISTLDPGGFGAVTITKSITIEGTQGQGYGSILHSGTTGVSIAFDNFTAVGEVQKSVRLRNLNFNGSGGASAVVLGLRGIRISGGAASAGSEVVIEDCVIDGSFGNPGRGIEDARTGGGKLFVSNTTIRNMSGTGISLAGGPTRLDWTIDRVRVFNCLFGIAVGSGARAVVTNSVISGNGTGLFVEGPAGAAELHVSHTVVNNNATGLQANAGGTMRIGNSEITNSTTNGTSGTIQSYGNNRQGGNAGVTTLTAIGADSHDKGQQ